MLNELQVLFYLLAKWENIAKTWFPYQKRWQLQRHLN